ncbi:MAG: hypothetical protein E7E35_09445, partial [Klebsiella sp.]|uniref:hypothetical protein n=1 Tax=Klebsiella sp. TaxID=576 RepID=UPI002913DDC4
AGVVTVPVAASARNNLKIRISLRRVSILRGEDQPNLSSSIKKGLPLKIFSKYSIAAWFS